jgi:hypothetical protein
MSSLSKRCEPAACLLTLIFLFATVATAAQKPPGNSPQNVLTYHGDNLRTGWFSLAVLNYSSLCPAAAALR